MGWLERNVCTVPCFSNTKSASFSAAYRIVRHVDGGRTGCYSTPRDGSCAAFSCSTSFGFRRHGFRVVALYKMGITLQLDLKLQSIAQPAFPARQRSWEGIQADSDRGRYRYIMTGLTWLLLALVASSLFQETLKGAMRFDSPYPYGTAPPLKETTALDQTRAKKYEKNAGKRNSTRGVARGHGRWPDTRRFGHRDIGQGTKKVQYL